MRVRQLTFDPPFFLGTGDVTSVQIINLSKTPRSTSRSGTPKPALAAGRRVGELQQSPHGLADGRDPHRLLQHDLRPELVRLWRIFEAPSKAEVASASKSPTRPAGAHRPFLSFELKETVLHSDGIPPRAGSGGAATPNDHRICAVGPEDAV